MIDNFSSIFYTFIFLLPGGIINTVVKSITPVKKISAGQELLRWLAYSIVNNAIWSWAFILLWENMSPESVGFWLILVAIVMFTSFLTGCLLGIILVKDVIRKAAKKIGLPIEHPVPTAWDYVFSKRDTPCYVIVTVNDGTKHYGYFGTASLASSDEDDRDIYLEYVYDLDENQEWIPKSNRRGMLINSSQISSIEFLEIEEDRDE